jgi:N-acetylmuramoyl-L-alanine amidase
MKHLILAAALLFTTAFVHAEPDWGTKVVAAVLVMEGDVDGEAGVHAVMNVIQNRANGWSLESYLKVVRKPKQFSCKNRVSEATLVTRASKHSTWQYALDLVEAACQDRIQDITGGATHYHALKKEPYWTKGMTLTTTIGAHKFYKQN